MKALQILLVSASILGSDAFSSINRHIFRRARPSLRWSDHLQPYPSWARRFGGTATAPCATTGSGAVPSSDAKEEAPGASLPRPRSTFVINLDQDKARLVAVTAELDKQVPR